MPVSASEAAERYRRGIDKVGISAYQEASRASSPQEAASTLESAKDQALSMDTLVSNYREAYS